MTTLEIILSIIIWVAYGFYAPFKTKILDEVLENGLIILYVGFSPIVFIWRCFVGAFLKDYKWD